jgi:hypothetical protein
MVGFNIRLEEDIFIAKENLRAWILPFIGLVWKALKYAWVDGALLINAVGPWP